MSTIVKLPLLLALLATVLPPAAPAAVTLAQWTFETSIPTTAGPLSPETGTGTATSNTGGTFSNPAGNGTVESWSSNGWGTGEFFQFEVSSTGYQNITLSWDQTGSDTGPKNFDLLYSTDGTIFNSFASYSVINGNWTPATSNPSTSYSYDLSSITGLNNDGSIFFRLQNTSTTSIGNGTVAAAGTGRVDNFTVSGDAVGAVPEPSRALLAMTGLLGMGLRRRRRQLVV